MSAMTTRAPSSTKRTAVALPIPLAAPVITATWPSSRPAMVPHSLAALSPAIDTHPDARTYLTESIPAIPFRQEVAMATAQDPGTARSPGLSYQELLDADTHEVPKVLREQSPRFL